MASTATMPPGGSAITSASGTPSSSNNASFVANAKPHLKTNATNRGVDGGRRQSGSPIDGPQRRNSSQKAWGQGTNPITQKSLNGPQANGMPSQPRGFTKMNPVSPKETNTPDRHANDRLLFLLATCLGYSATITIKNGDEFEGIFAGSSFDANESTWLLKMVKQTAFGPDRQVNGVERATAGYIGTGPEYTMRFEMKDVADLAIGGVTLGDSSSQAQNGTPTSNFRTDTDISGNLAVRERTLQRWDPSGDSEVDLSLEGPTIISTTSSSTSTAWDQFEVNERLYGVKSDYDETFYTTAIDRSNPLYKQRSAAAEKIAREIEASSAMNAHVAEERGLKLPDDTGAHEEEKYSGVNRGPNESSVQQFGQSNKYTLPARRGAPAPSTSGPALQDPAILSSQVARADTSAKGPEGQSRVLVNQQRTIPSITEARTPTMTRDNTSKPSLPVESATVRSKVAPTDKPSVESVQKQPTALVSAVQSVPSAFAKVPGESAAATVENDVRDAFKQFASTEKMRLQERRRNQAKHDKDIKLNDLMKFSQNFKLVTPVPVDLVPILAKDKSKQEEIIERAQRNANELGQGSSTGHRPIATTVDPKPQKSVVPPRYESGTSSGQQAAPERQNLGRARVQQNAQNNVNGQSNRPPQGVPTQPARTGPNLGQRLANIHQQQQQQQQQQNRVENRVAQSHVASPPPMPIQEGRAPPTGPAAISTHLANTARYPSALTPTSSTSTQFNAKAHEFRPNPAANSFTPTGEPSIASSPRSNAHSRAESRVPTPSSFFGAKKPLPASERPSIHDLFNPIKRLRKEAEDNKEDWTSNGGIPPAHKTGPRWDVAEANKDKIYTEMFERISFSTQSVSPHHPQYAAPQLTHQHQLPLHLQLGGAVISSAPAPHQNPHHLHPQQQHHPAAGLPHQFDEHHLHIPSAPSVGPSPRLRPVNLAYPSPMGQHAQLVYGQPMPQYGMGPVAPQMTPLRQFSGGAHFMSQPGGHMAAPMMTHSPSGGPLPGMSQGFSGPFNQQMPMYSPNTVHAFPHHGGPPPTQPGSNGYPSPGRGAPMMIHQGSQQGQSAQQMMVFGMSPGQQSQHLYVPHQPGQVPAPRGGGYVPPQHPHYGVVPHSHHFPNHHRNAPSFNHSHGPQSANVAGHPMVANPSMGAEGEDDVK